MTPINLTSDEQRAMKRLVAAVDRVTQADRKFFERFPARRHRVRRASRAEIEQHTILDGEPWMPPGCAIYAVVKNIALGVRFRVFLRAPDDRETDVSEAVARAIYETTATPRTREIEQELRRSAAGAERAGFGR